MDPPSTGKAGFNFNTFQEIKSHSSILYNERMAIQFYLLDMHNLRMHKTKSVDSIYDVYASIRQIYKNTRMLLRFNPIVRATMNLETKDRGVYTIDIAMGLIDKMIKYCEVNEFTMKRMHIIIQELDNVEMMIKDVLQYFSYFIRPDFSQKPDVEIATEKYKEIADRHTVEELKNIVGKNNLIDFDSLGSSRIELETDKIEYDPIIDGDLSEYDDDDDNKLYLDNDEDEYDTDTVNKDYETELK